MTLSRLAMGLGLALLSMAYLRDALRSGERIEIALDTTAIHLFDPATTKAIV